MLAVKNALVQSVCCKRAYIRGAFIAAGSMSDPSKSYHFEIVCGELAQAEYVRDMINSFDLDAKIVTRKKTFVVYLKEGSQIVDVLNIMEAHIALMELENVRILKEMRNSEYQQDRIGGRKADGRYCVCQRYSWLGLFAGRIKRRCPYTA